MARELDKASEVLRNRDAGWVNRRDAAETLGKWAAEAVDELHRFREDEDQDVRAGVERALGWASGKLRGVKPVAQERPFTLKELVEGLEKEGRRDIRKDGDGYVVTVQLKNERTHDVHIEPYKRRDGIKIVRVYTGCGKPTEHSLQWALHNNMSLVQGALALTEEDGEEVFVLINCFLEDHVTPDELKACVKEIAFYGDWIENKLTGEDEM